MPKKKEVTIEKLAEMIERGFEATATKESVKGVEERLDAVEERLNKQGEDIKILREDMEAGFSGVIAALKSIQNEIKDLKKLDIEVAELRRRIERVEKKLGI